jgi:hypothetical protein
MTSYVRINFSSGLSFFLLRPYYSDFADRLIKDPVALTRDLKGSHSRAVIVSGEMTDAHFEKYIHLTGAGLIVYPPPEAQLQYHIERTYAAPPSTARTHVSYIANVMPNRKEYKVDGTRTPMNLLSRFTSDSASITVPLSFASSFPTSHEANVVKKRVEECLKGVTLASPHHDKWPHYNYMGKGGLIFQLEFSRTMDAKSKSVSCLASNVKSWFLTSYSPWPMKRAKLTCMYIGENVHEDIVRKTILYTPVGACDITIMNLAQNVHEYISRHLSI